MNNKLANSKKESHKKTSLVIVILIEILNSLIIKYR